MRCNGIANCDYLDVPARIAALNHAELPPEICTILASAPLLQSNLKRSKGIIVATGDTEAGKTRVAIELLHACAHMNNETLRAAILGEYGYMHAPSAFREYRLLQYEERHLRYRSLLSRKMEVWDDLDKIEEKDRALVRDMLVNRADGDTYTIITATSPEAFLEFDQQVQARICRGWRIELSRKSDQSMNLALQLGALGVI